MNFKQWLILSETITVKDEEFRDPLNALKHIQATHPNPENLVVTFTAIDKVGINPKSTYSTPFGIYFYPLDYVIEKKINVPFAGDQPYINVCEFTRPDKILHMTDDVNNQKGLELLNIFPQEEVDAAMQNISNKYIFRSDYSKLWLVTKQIAGKRAIDVYYGVEEKTNEAVLWNTNLRKCGIDGFLDHGTGTIHTNEPTQGVVFTANSLKRILVIPQRLFTKQGESMPVRKPLPDLNRIPLNQLENLLKTRNLSDNDFHYLLAFAPDKDEMAKLIVQHVKELSVNNIIGNLLDVASDKQEMARLIAQHVTELSSRNISFLLSTADDKDEMARFLGPDNINKLSGDHVYNLLLTTSDKEKMAEILGPDNINKLNYDNVYHLLYYAPNKNKMAIILGPENINKLNDENVNNLLYCASDKDQMVSIIIKHKKESTDANVFALLFYASDKEKIARILGPDNINKLTGKNVQILLHGASDKVEMAEILGSDNINKITDDRLSILLKNASDKDQMVSIIIKHKKELTDANVFALLSYASDKEKIAEILGSDNINKLTNDNVTLLLGLASDKVEMARILRQENINKLSGDRIYVLLNTADDKEKIAEILGPDNINKLNDMDIYNLLMHADDKEKMRQFLRKYYTGTNPEVISSLE
jgi:hypothetical protein